MLAPPTWITLHTLSAHSSVEVAISAAAAAPALPTFVTEMRRGDSGIVTLWHGDVAYGQPDIGLDHPGPRHRLVLNGSGPWQYDLGD